MWICPKCANHHDDQVATCPVCGTRLLSAPSEASVPHYPAPVDPWASQADTQTSMTIGPGSGSPRTADPATPPPGAPTPGPARTGPATPAPGPTRALAGPVVPAPPSTRPLPTHPGAGRPPTIEVTHGGGVPRRWVIVVAAVFVAGVGVATAIVVPKLVSGDHGGTPAPTHAAGSPSPPPPASTGASAAPASTGPHKGGLVVAVSPEVTDGRADEVVAMLDVYFNGINAKDYPAVGTVLDPDGTTDPDDEDDMDELADGTRSTRDSDIMLTSIDDLDHGLLSAEVTFRSRQKAGDGPRGRPAETCTRWDIVYTLSHHSAYRIRKSDAKSQPC
jgi:hypothetical protein